MVFADVSMWQGFIPSAVDAVVVKATQGRTTVDQRYEDHLNAARGRQMRHVGHYHFLTSDDPPEMQWSFFRQAVETVGGGLRVGEFVALDWESNAITGEAAPDPSVARRWLDLAGEHWPGRVCWYSYRSLASAARQSGLFPEPLWLSDPNPDNHDWAQRLGAFLLQSGQDTLDGVHIDVNDVIDPAQLDRLCGYTTGDDDMDQRAFSAMLAHACGGEEVGLIVGQDDVVYLRLRNGVDYPLGKVWAFTHQEAQDAATAAKAAVVQSSGPGTLASPAVIADAVMAEAAARLSRP